MARVANRWKKGHSWEEVSQKLRYSSFYEHCKKQVITRRDDMPLLIAADLCPCVDGSTIRTALEAWPRHSMPSWPRHLGQVGQTDGWIEASLNTPLQQAAY